MHRSPYSTLICTIASIVLAATAFAAPAAAFAPVRPVRIASDAEFESAVPYGESKILLLRTRLTEGPGAIIRVNLDGSLDRSFGDRGEVVIDAEDAAVTSDGKILVATSTGGGRSALSGRTKARITRLLPDGKIDRSFARGGHADGSFGGHGLGETVAVNREGDILLGGTHVGGRGIEDLAVARLRPNGSPDRSFGNEGVSIIAVGDEVEAMDVAPTPDGGIVLMGGDELNAYLYELRPGGAPDRRFGPGGSVAIQGKVGRSGVRQQLNPTPGFVELADGALLVAADGLGSGPTRGLVERLRPDGRVDSSWGDEGWATVRGVGETSAAGLTLLPRGVVAVATTTGGIDTRGIADFGAVAFDRRGRPDRDFATDGTCRVPQTGGQRAVGIVRLAGRAVVTGTEDGTGLLLACPPPP